MKVFSLNFQVVKLIPSLDIWKSTSFGRKIQADCFFKKLELILLTTVFLPKSIVASNQPMITLPITISVI
ncbi:MAG: hypothetical protein CM1200mP1_10680 [Candidatus Neomarinimicrobiota bacterium]|nr:MAG: hypothetical protein CM1200mP1_10680 [Candidatus Neomarinimicrobiota bacterium]